MARLMAPRMDMNRMRNTSPPGGIASAGSVSPRCRHKAKLVQKMMFPIKSSHMRITLVLETDLVFCFIPEKRLIRRWPDLEVKMFDVSGCFYGPKRIGAP